MIVFIVQHGEAVSKALDPERPLSQQGSRDIRGLAARLEMLGAKPGVIIHSGKLRAAQTAAILADTLTPGAATRLFEGVSPMDDPMRLISELDRLQPDPDGSVLIATHMPYVSRLVSTLLTRQPDTPFASVPGTAIALEYGEHGWQMNWMIRPGCF